MACPYFYPLHEAAPGDVRPARIPLGALHEGRCDAEGGPERSSGDACNFGYAAGRCPVFPLPAEADAVRFTVLDGRTMFVLEKDFMPVRHGNAAELNGDTTLGRQAEVFAAWLTSRH